MDEKRFALLTDPENRQIWDEVYGKIRFNGPDANAPAFVFQFDTPCAGYSIADIMTSGREELWAAFEKEVDAIFKSITAENEFVYALDWQHSGFRMWPHRKPPTAAYEETFYDEPVGVYKWTSHRDYYPCFIPDGDYHFFIAPNFSWGYLGHPWKQEVWVFGRDIQNAFDTQYADRKVHA